MKPKNATPKPSGPGAAMRDLPPGSRVTTRSTTTVAPHAGSAPATATTTLGGPTVPDYPAPPPMPLAPHHFATARSQTPATVPTAPARPYRPTFDEPPAAVLAHRQMAQQLRRSLGTTLRQVEQCIQEAGRLLDSFDSDEAARAEAGREGVDLAEAREFHSNLRKLVDDSTGVGTFAHYLNEGAVLAIESPAGRIASIEVTEENREACDALVRLLTLPQPHKPVLDEKGNMIAILTPDDPETPAQ